MQDESPELLDIREAADFLRVSETSLRRWTNAGRLPCLRIGGRRERRFRRDDLLAFIGAAGGAAPPPLRNHFCELYTSDLGRVRGAAAFLGVGLQSGALCLLAAEKDVQRAVVARLEHDRPGRLVVLLSGGVSCLGGCAARVLARAHPNRPQDRHLAGVCRRGPLRRGPQLDALRRDPRLRGRV